MLITLRDVVMKVLRASNIVPPTIFQEGPKLFPIVYPLDEIHITAPTKWTNKKMVPFTESIESVGMMWPIILVDLENYWEPMKSKRWPRDESGEFIPGVAVHTGNKRVIWARENGYEAIESYLVTNRQEKDCIVTHTFLPIGHWPGQKTK